MVVIYFSHTVKTNDTPYKDLNIIKKNFGSEKEAEYLWYALIMETGWPFLREKKVFQYFVVKFIFDV